MSLVSDAVRIEFNELNAPSDDGGALVVPSASQWANLARTNHQLLAQCRAPLLDRPLHLWRDSFRAALGFGPEQVVIVVGHQPECFHAGVWAKYVVARRFADAIGGVALDLVVDNDAAKNLSLSLPEVSESRVRLEKIPLASSGRHHTYEQVPAVPAERIREIREKARRSLSKRWDSSGMPRFFEGLRDAVSLPRNARGDTPAVDWVSQLLCGRRRLDESWGVTMNDRRVSELPANPLVADMIFNAERFAACYNNALRAYRREHAISGNRRPMPDLDRKGDRYELPLWFVAGPPGLAESGTGQLELSEADRSRVFVETSGDQVRLFAGEEVVAELSRSDVHRAEICRDARAANVTESGSRDVITGFSTVASMLRPRALTLTLSARLLLADLFVHGIGGAKYDRMTDALIHDYYGLEAPPFACVTATLRMNLDGPTVSVSDVQRKRTRMRDFHWNPQRQLPASRLDESLVALRQQAVDLSGRLRREAPYDRHARRAVFESIRAISGQLRSLAPGFAEALESEWEQARAHRVSREIAQNREYFYGLHDSSRLQAMMDTLPASGDFGL